MLSGPPVAIQRTALLIAAVLTASSAGNPLVGTEPSTSPTNAPAPSSTSGVRLDEVKVTTAQYRPGVEADLHLRLTDTMQPVLVMVLGGAWETADHRGLSPLASFLAEAGVVFVNARVRAASDGVVYPAPVEDVLCALAFGVARAEVSGVSVGPLGSLRRRPRIRPGQFTVRGGPATKPPGHRTRGTRSPRPTVDPNFRCSCSTAAPTSWSRSPPRPTSTEALEAGGHQVTLNVLANADHHSIYSPELAGDLLLEWIRNVADGWAKRSFRRQPGNPRRHRLLHGSVNYGATSFGTLSPVDTLDRGLLLRKGEVWCSHGSSIEGRAVLDGS
jgi:hypothetical protein